MRGYDAWVTREPDWASYEEPPQPHCGACGGFLSRLPARTESWEQSEACDGQPARVSYTYTEADRDILDIIGWDHLGEVTWEEYDPACGEARPHEPHDFVLAAGTTEYRACRRCGEENKWVEA